MKRWVYLFAVMMLAFTGCDDDDGGGSSSSMSDAVDLTDDTADSQSTDDTTDTGTDTGGGDTGSDGSMNDADTADMTPLSCEFPAPQIGGTTQGDALAQDPARCGQAAHEWVTNPADVATLGDLVEWGGTDTLTYSLLSGVLAMEGVSIPAGPQYDVTIRQFSYITQDRGQLIEATAVVAYPQGLDPTSEGVTPLLMVHGTAGFNDDCAPSSNLAWKALSALFASFGYVVIAPDFIGLKGVGEPTGFLHPYLSGQATAIASLDAMRALGKLPTERRGGVCVSDNFVVYGPSQGGHAALWVERLAPYYSPELTLLGGVAAVPPMDLIPHGARGLQELVGATGFMVAMFGTLADWYGLGDQLDTVFLPPYDTEVPAALGMYCNPGDALTTEPSSIDEVFQAELVSAAAGGTLADLDPWGCLFTENSLTTTSIAPMPSTLDSYGMLVLVGEQDDLVFPEFQRTSFETLCGAGADYAYLECLGAEHEEAPLWSLQETFDFLDARIARESLPMGSCTLSTAVTCTGSPATP